MCQNYFSICICVCILDAICMVDFFYSGYNLQWWIYIQKFWAHAPPNRIKFFQFYICFHQKAPVLEVDAPPMRVGTPQQEILDLPLIGQIKNLYQNCISIHICICILDTICILYFLYSGYNLMDQKSVSKLYFNLYLYLYLGYNLHVGLLVFWRQFDR